VWVVVGRDIFGFRPPESFRWVRCRVYLFGMLGLGGFRSWLVLTCRFPTRLPMNRARGASDRESA